jgi:CDP-diacylglycerol---serine O-phosphatidyltransferase
LKIFRFIPNFLTLLNLFSGCLGISMAYQKQLTAASLLIGVAAIFDFFDGMAARLLNVKSEIGKELDSLADLVSFGVLPATIIYMLMINATEIPVLNIGKINAFVYIPFIIPLFSAYRLAKFNLDVRQTESFLGLPTPAAAIIFGSFPLIIYQITETSRFTSLLGLFSNFYFLSIASLIVCFLLISELPLISLKFKSFKWQGNKSRYILILFSLASLSILGFVALPLIIFAYILISLIAKPFKTASY